MNGSLRVACFWVLAGLLLVGCGSGVGRNIEKLGSATKKDRDAALMELMLAKGAAIPPLIEALADVDESVRVRAKRALSAIRD